MYLLYDIVTSLAAGPGALGLALKPQRRALLRRFRPLTAPLSGRPVWFQAVSVGELGVAKTLVNGLRERRPELPVLLTTSTMTGYKAAPGICPDATVAFFPFDHFLSVEGFVRRAAPRALVLLETEIWPNVVRVARRQGIPVILLNARLSDKHYPRYERFRKFTRPIFASLTAVGVQNEEYAERFRALGTRPEAIRVTGNTKFDGVRTEGRDEVRARVRSENGLPPEAPVLLFASTRPGDEALASRCWQALREEMPDLLLVVAPRHRERLEEALACFDEPVLLRTQVQAGRARQGERVFVVDTLGELAGFCAAADVAVIGGSFYPGVNGHNPLEAAGYGIPTVFGPFMRNFIDPARVLVQANAAEQVRDPERLLPVLEGLLRDPERQRSMGQRAREAVLANQGASQRSLALLEEILSVSSAD
jgi:3-deoxy-D-manno-octulosonic-acid transferase